MSALRLAVLAAALGGGMVGGLYAAAASARAGDRAPEPETAVTLALVVPAELPPVEPTFERFDEVPAGIDVPEEDAVLLDAYAEEILDEASGLRMSLALAPEPFVLATSPAASRRGARASAPVVLGPRLDPNPGRHVILTARRMMSRGETVRGSCYRYVSEVFSRAGHDGWRTRTIVHGSRREGPYADLGLIRPGDWLYIVNHPETTPMGTHSVLFVGWEDRGSGYARVLQHSGGGSESAGDERGYDVSRTYRIVRPILPS